MKRRKNDKTKPSFLLTFVYILITLFLLARFSLPRTNPIYPPLLRNFDVIVVGSGLSGNLAAIAATQNSADVLYLEVSGQQNGAPPYLPVFWAAETTLQATEQVFYLAETMANDIYARTAQLGNYPQILTVSLTSAEGLQWLQTLTTFSFTQLDVGTPGLHLGQYNIISNMLEQSTQRVTDKVLAHSTTLKPLRLLIERNVIKGVLVLNEAGQEEKILARAVILADGGYASNQEMLAELAGVTGTFARVDAGQLGLGLTLAQDIGARTEGMTQVDVVPVMLATGERIDTLTVEGNLFFNENGLLLTHQETVKELLQQNKGKVFFVAGADSEPPVIPTVVIEDIEQLAAALKTSSAELALQLPTIAAPFRLAEIGLMAITPGGLVVTENYQVEGKEIPITGLYAAGEGTSGMHGAAAIYELLLTESVVGALLAGQNAAAYARR